MQFDKTIGKKIFEAALKKKDQIIFFQYNNVDYLQNTIEKFLDEFPEEKSILNLSPNNYSFEPYYPFINLIKMKLKELDEKETIALLNKAKIYNAHKSIFVNNITGKKIERNEEIVFEEIKYEQNKMHQNIWNLFYLLYGNSPLVLIFENINLFPASTFELLKDILSASSHNKILFLFTLSYKEHSICKINNDEWLDFYETISKTSSQFRIFSKNEVYTEYKRQLNITVNEHILNTLLNFLCLKDCHNIDHCSNIMPEIILDDIKKSIVQNLAESYLLAHAYDKARILFQKILDYARKKNDILLMAIIYRKLGVIAYNKTNLPDAKKFAFQSQNLLHQIKDNNQTFYTNSLLLLINFREQYYTRKEWKSKFIKNIELGEKLGFVNNLAYWLGRFDPFDPTKDEKIVSTNISRAIEICKKYNNDFRLASAIHILAFVKQSNSHIDEAYNLYKKSCKLRLQINDLDESSYINNALGYLMIQKGNYKKAHSFFYTALKLALKSKNYHEVAICFCNMAINSFYSLKFIDAIIYFEHTQKIKEIAHIKYLSFHTNYEMNSFSAIASILNENIVKAYDYLNLLKINNHKFLYNSQETIENEFITKLLYALFEEYKNNIKKAVINFNQAKSILLTNYSFYNFKYRVPFFYKIYSDFLKRNNIKKEYKSICQKGLNESLNQNNKFYLTIFEKNLNSDSNEKKSLPKYKEVDFDAILNAIKAEIALQDLQKALDQINSINNFQYLIDRFATVDSLVKKSIEFINATFAADLIIFSLKVNNQWQQIEELIAPGINWQLSKNDPSLPEYLSEKYRISTTLDCQKDDRLKSIPFDKIIHIPLGHVIAVQGHILYAKNENEPLKDDEFKTLNIMAKNLIAAVDKVYNKKILKNKV